MDYNQVGEIQSLLPIFSIRSGSFSGISEEGGERSTSSAVVRQDTVLTQSVFLSCPASLTLPCSPWHLSVRYNVREHQHRVPGPSKAALCCLGCKRAWNRFPLTSFKHTSKTNKVRSKEHIAVCGVPEGQWFSVTVSQPCARRFWPHDVYQYEDHVCF